MPFILLATDGSEHSTAAARLVGSIPWPPETTIGVVSVVLPSVSCPACRGRSLLRRSGGGRGFGTRQGPAGDLDSGRRAPGSRAARTLPGHARTPCALDRRSRRTAARGPDRGRQPRAWNRGVGARGFCVRGLIDRAPCPVLVARTETLGHTIIADDGTPQAELARAYVRERPHLLGHETRLVGVAPLDVLWLICWRRSTRARSGCSPTASRPCARDSRSASPRTQRTPWPTESREPPRSARAAWPTRSWPPGRHSMRASSSSAATAGTASTGWPLAACRGASSNTQHARSSSCAARRRKPWKPTGPPKSQASRPAEARWPRRGRRCRPSSRRRSPDRPHPARDGDLRPSICGPFGTREVAASGRTLHRSGRRMGRRRPLTDAAPLSWPADLTLAVEGWRCLPRSSRRARGRRGEPRGLPAPRPDCGDHPIHRQEDHGDRGADIDPPCPRRAGCRSPSDPMRGRPRAKIRNVTPLQEAQARWPMPTDVEPPTTITERYSAICPAPTQNGR